MPGDPQSLLSIVLDLWTEADPDVVMDGEGRKMIASLGFYPLDAPDKIAY